MEKATIDTPSLYLDKIIDELIEYEIEKKKRCLVPYERLSIECNRKESSKKKVEYLLDDEENRVGATDSGISKWLAQFAHHEDSTLDLTITIKDQYPPLMLTHYAMKPANDNPKRDPRQW